MMSLELVQPYALLGLLLLPIFVLLHRASRSRLPSKRRRTALALRLLVVAASGPRIVQSTDQLAVAFLIDSSDSVPPGVREQAVNWVRQALASKSDRDRSVVIAFAEH